MQTQSPQDQVKQIIASAELNSAEKFKKIKAIIKAIKQVPVTAGLTGGDIYPNVIKTVYPYTVLKYGIMTLCDLLTKQQCLLLAKKAATKAAAKAKANSSVFSLESSLELYGNTPLMALTAWFALPTLKETDMELVLEMALEVYQELKK
jgi:hypothetical protein